MFRIIGWVERLCERIVYGPEDDSDREVSQALDRAFRRGPDDFVDFWLQDCHRKERLNQELANTEWILRYESVSQSSKEQLRRADRRQSKLGPTPTASGDSNTTSLVSAGTSPSTSVPALSS